MYLQYFFPYKDSKSLLLVLSTEQLLTEAFHCVYKQVQIRH